MAASTSQTSSADSTSGSGQVVSTESSSTNSSGSAAAPMLFAADSVFNLPLGSSAQWESNDQLSNANLFVNTTQSGYNQNIYTSSASDPLVTVQNSGASGGSAGSFQLHIPANAVGASGSDRPLSVDDTTTGTWYSFSGFSWTGNNTASVSQGSAESDTGSGITQDGSNFDQGVGTLRESDLQSGSIDHMLRIQLPPDMLKSYSNSVTQLAPYAWPQTQEDGFAINGNGGTPYSGTVPYGVTLGIPVGAAEPDAVKNNAGADMLWRALQTHGAMIRDSAGSGNTVTLQADQNVDPNDPLIQGMDQFGSQIMSSVQILTNQGPNSVNGGGTSVSVGGGSSSSTSTASTSAGTGTTTSATTGGSTSSSTDNGQSAANLDTASGSTTSGSTDIAATTASSGASGSTTGDNATISSATLSGGGSGSGSSSGMSFVASPTPGGTSQNASGTSSSGTSSGTSAAASDGNSGTLPDVTVSSSDFSSPTSQSTSWSSHHHYDGSGGGHGGWWMSQHSQSGIAAHG